MDPKIPAFPVTGTGVDFENTVDTPPGVPPAACGDLFLQVQTGPATCSNVPAPVGFGYFGATGDEANAVWATPGVLGLADDVDAFDSSPPATALTTGIYFCLAPGSPSLATIPATPGDILYSPPGGGPVTIATLAGAGPATDVFLGIADQDLNALDCIAASPGVIALGPIGPTACSPGGGSHLIEFSISYTAVPGIPFFPADVLGVFGPGAAGVLTPAVALGLCTPPACPNNEQLDNLNALEDPSGIELPCPWDLDGDGLVGIVDFLDLLAQWGTDPGGPPDFDGSGNVGITDFLELLANWGECP